MLLAEPTFAGYARNEVADPAKSTEVILVLGLDNPEQVNEFVDKAFAAGAMAIGEPVTAGGLPDPSPEPLVPDGPGHIRLQCRRAVSGLINEYRAAA